MLSRNQYISRELGEGGEGARTICTVHARMKEMAAKKLCHENVILFNFLTSKLLQSFIVNNI